MGHEPLRVLDTFGRPSRAIIVGAAIPVLARTRPINYGAGSFVCGLHDATWDVDRLDRQGDVFSHRRPEWEPAAMEDLFAILAAPGRDRPGCGSATRS
jgi:hypothetical protein